ncbi:hypothetical protein [Paraburkholderia xenovorans]
MKKLTAVAIVALLVALNANAQTTSTAQQTSTSQSVAQGTIQFSQSPADQHLTETVHNVSAPVEGAFASSFSQLNCGQTAQGGVAFAGFSAIAGASKDSFSCVLEVASNESVKQATVTADPAQKAALQAAAVAIRCQISPEIFKAYQAAGLDCLGLKPSSMTRREDTQPASTRIVSGN